MNHYVEKDPRFVDFGDRVRATRKGIGKTQEELAEASGLSVSSVGRAERGEPVDRKTIEALEEALYIPFDQQICPGIRTCPKAHQCLKEIIEYLVKFPDSRE